MALNCCRGKMLGRYRLLRTDRHFLKIGRTYTESLVRRKTVPSAFFSSQSSFDGGHDGKSRKSTQTLKEERDRVSEMMHPKDEDTVQADGLAMIRKVLMASMSEEDQIKEYGRRLDAIPDFCTEIQHEGLPLGVDHKRATEYLHLAYENACLFPHLIESAMKRPGYEPEPRELFARLHAILPEKLEWYVSGEPGSIFTGYEAPRYGIFTRHSFSNQNYRKEQLHQGTTHVAVGFVDLGILLEADLSDERTGPLRFLGVEMSAYAVAKTHVVWELIKSTPLSSQQARTDHERRILQVWFSTTWTTGTHDLVKAILSWLCSPDKCYHPEVRTILEHWHGASEVPLDTARSEFAAVTSSGRSAVGYLLEKQDRMAMAKYELTGDFGVKGRPVCGNLLMFDCPDGTPPLDKDETVFAALNFKDVMETVASNGDLDILAAAETDTLGKIAKLVSWSHAGRVVVELKCAKFEDTIDEVAVAKPYTMSWSNVIDYVEYHEFHEMARQCSKHGNTVHFGYSMNWIANVFGTSIIDFPGDDFVEDRRTIINGANAFMKRSFKNLGWDKRIRLPLPSNPLNATSKYLQRDHYATWSDFFFDKARPPCVVRQVELITGCPLSVTPGSLALSWSY